MTTGIQGKVAVVTGGASGIGRATALAFAREGARVAVVTGRSVAAAQETVEQIAALGGEAFFVRCDVSNESQVEAMVAEVLRDVAALAFSGGDRPADPGLRAP